MRKPGGQQGNQNARIHGYYSKILDEDEQKYYRQAAKFVGLDAEIVLLRVKLIHSPPGLVDAKAQARQNPAPERPIKGKY